MGECAGLVVKEAQGERVANVTVVLCAQMKE